MVGVVIVAHLRLAEELLNVARIVTVRELNNFSTVSIDLNDSPERAREKLLAAVKKVGTGNSTVIMVDMFGGTPSNLSLSLLSRGKVEIITGVNLPMVIEAAYHSLTTSLDELIPILTASGQRSIRAAGTILEKHVVDGKES